MNLLIEKNRKSISNENIHFVVENKNYNNEINIDQKKISAENEINIIDPQIFLNFKEISIDFDEISLEDEANKTPSFGKSSPCNMKYSNQNFLMCLDRNKNNVNYKRTNNSLSKISTVENIGNVDSDDDINFVIGNNNIQDNKRYSKIIYREFSDEEIDNKCL